MSFIMSRMDFCFLLVAFSIGFLVRHHLGEQSLLHKFVSFYYRNELQAIQKSLLKQRLRASVGTNNNPILLPGSTILLPGRSIYSDLLQQGTTVLPVPVHHQISIWFYLRYLIPVLILIMAFCVQVLC